ncbi:hypothetical protein KSF_095110 [Reticulibacter mediterranei]|uniref:Uncharacterized protein n=1 Tax=Reticulibacter mediterranei TaxID=2778369 RepID=A0A8J3IVS3_9CHLR|nr:hypothetical protein [Reticulibacter mediterranei]GHO99463.1 hypothetical protein KSF_095110 [Reticulibacter mediterranei]
MDRFEAVQWLQKELEGERRAAPLVDALNEAWCALDELSEYLLPETVIALLLAYNKPAGEREELTVSFNIGLSELFALKAAVACYDTTLRKSDAGADKIALPALERLHQHLLTAIV